MRVGLNPKTFARKTIRRENNNNKKINLFTIVTRGLVFLFLVYIGILVRYRNSDAYGNHAFDVPDHKVSQKTIKESTKKKDVIDTCEFRKYPPRRFYGLNQKPLPDFLQVDYIFGEAPQLLRPKADPPVLKLCVDQSEWEVPFSVRRPFADGTNPSLLKLHDNPRIDPSIAGFFPKEAWYLATICMTNSQCAWKDSKEEQEEYKLSQQQKPSSIRTVLLVLDEHFKTLQEATINLLIDAQFGRKLKPKIDLHGKYQERVLAFDDARLFTYKGQVWVSYREGPSFGYDKQVLNIVNFSFGSDDLTAKFLKVTLKASEAETLCCGRNMALIEDVHTNTLNALTWVDPVTVETVELKNTGAAAVGRRLQEDEEEDTGLSQQHGIRNRRQLAEKDESLKPSDFHGTNGFMVYLPKTQEYLGIGHFHRPPGREFDNAYARFGHHYTHAFYTISDQSPFHLKRISPELLLPSQSDPNDAEIIQFWSGLERINDDTLSLAYGINDCEGAALSLDMQTVESLLRDIPEGSEVRNLMKPLAPSS